jgi:NAD(P)-dependent dehydrogenase (short-subunit alcohol dehydrogenase family)
MLRFDGRTAIVTGAGGGIGRAHALLLASRGASVVVNDIGGSVAGAGRDVGPAELVARTIVEAGGRAVADTNSVATPEGGAALVATAVDAFGSVDIVVNNAGILRDKSFGGMEAALLDPVIDVHLKGAFNVTRPAWNRMKDQGYGRIVSTSSASGLLGNFGQSNYGAAKAGLMGLTRVLAIEGARYGIRANVLAPGARTRMTENLLGDLADALDPALVSPVLAYLAHEDCEVTGEIYTVGGGRVARMFLGVTPGVFRAELTPEDVRDNLAAIRSEDGYIVPGDASEEAAELLKWLGRG